MIYCNDAYAELAGYSKSELYGKNPVDLLQWKIEFENGAFIRYLRPDDKIIWVVTSIQSFYDDEENLIGYIRMPRDITQCFNSLSTEIADNLTGVLELVRTNFGELRSSLKKL